MKTNKGYIFLKDKNKYQVNKVYKGKRLKRVTANTQEEILEIIKELEAEVEKELFLADHYDLNVKFEDVFMKYHERILMSDVAASKEKKLRGVLKNHFSDVANMRMVDIQTSHIVQWCENLLKKHSSQKTGKKDLLGADKINKYLGTMKNILVFANNANMLYNEINLSIFQNYVLRKDPPRKEENTISYQAWLKICDSIKKYNLKYGAIIPNARQTIVNHKGNMSDFYYFVFRFLYMTGLRISEALALTYGDFFRNVDEKGRTINFINVNKEVVDGTSIVKNSTKTLYNRKVYFVEELYNEILAYKELMGHTTKDFVFDYYGKGKTLTSKTLNAGIKRVIGELIAKEYISSDLVEEGLSCKAFRKGNTYYLQNILKFDIKEAAINQGHSVSVMFNYYYADYQGRIEKINFHINNDKKGDE